MKLRLTLKSFPTFAEAKAFEEAENAEHPRRKNKAHALTMMLEDGTPYHHCWYYY